ncbi:gamma-glutamylcyclotransferase [Patescibacteria group bacterium]|nr:MAG: gamma-glutamylcyclotransferase [Patescibacteria group bacterium]
MLCLSYGSNMSITRIQDRVPSARPVAVATLPKHRLKFHKVSNDGSGKCDAQATEDTNDYVIGVLFEISDNEKPALDNKEGLGVGYDEKEVEVVTTDGRTMKSVMYFATSIDPSRRPYTWYKNHVLKGAKENGLPEEYISKIEAVIADDDPDRARNERESSIYR